MQNNTWFCDLFLLIPQEMTHQSDCVVNKCDRKELQHTHLPNLAQPSQENCRCSYLLGEHQAPSARACVKEYAIERHERSQWGWAALRHVSDASYDYTLPHRFHNLRFDISEFNFLERTRTRENPRLPRRSNLNPNRRCGVLRLKRRDTGDFRWIPGRGGRGGECI